MMLEKQNTALITLPLSAMIFMIDHRASIEKTKSIFILMGGIHE